MDKIFHRTELAHPMARQLLKPGVLDEGLRSGLFISGLRRTGKTTFRQSDLVPALEAAGAIVIYVDLWSNTQANPASLVHAAIRRAPRCHQPEARDPRALPVHRHGLASGAGQRTDCAA